MGIMKGSFLLVLALFVASCQPKKFLIKTGSSDEDTDYITSGTGTGTETVDQVDNSARLIGTTIPEAKSLIEREDIFHGGIKVTSIWVVERDGKKGFNPNQFNRDHGRLNVATKNERILKFLIFLTLPSQTLRG